MISIQTFSALIVGVACFLPFIQSEPVVLPASFKTCNRNDPDLAGCVMRSIEIIKPNLKTGDFGNGFKIDPLEPLKIADINIERPGLTVSLTDILVKGATNFKISKLRINTDQFKVDVIVEVPRLEAKGNYKLNMMIGVIALKGEGIADTNIDTVKLKLSISGTRYIKDGEEYIRPDKADVRLKIVKLHFHFNNLFNGDKTLGDLGNQLVNDNIDLFLADIEPSLQASLGEQFLKSANQVFEKAPMNVFLP